MPAMRRLRYLALLVLLVITGSSLLTTGGLAWYWRSAAYCRYCAEVLSSSLALPAEIGRVVPRSWRAREFRDVRIWLPERRGEAAFCARAILRLTPAPGDPDAYELDLQGGHSEVSARTWLREDYRFVLESGLRPIFDPNGPRRVRFRGMDLAFERDRFRLVLTNASGEVSFTDPHCGQARVFCRELNGYAAPQEVKLRATFSPQTSGVRLDHVELNVPELPVAISGLEGLLGLPLRSGSFQGQLVYRELPPGSGGDTGAPPAAPDDRELIVRGSLRGLQLPECTAPFFARPWRGSVTELELQELLVRNERVERIGLRGVFTGVQLGDVLAPWNLGSVGGEVRLRIQAAEITGRGLERLILAARCEDVALAEVSRALGRGGISGRARLVVDDLTVLDNRLVSLDARAEVAPSGEDDRYIERELLTEVLRQALNVELPTTLVRQLPERLEYDQLGVRLEVRDELLYVFGTHGPRERAILSVRLAGQPVPVVFEPEEPFNLRSHFDALRRAWLPEFERRWQALSPQDAWRALAAPQSQEPASDPVGLPMPGSP